MMRVLRLTLLTLGLGVSSALAQVTLIQQTGARPDAAGQYSTTATSAATLTLTPNGGETVYVYSIAFSECSDGTGPTPGAVMTIASTNIGGNPSWTMGTGSTVANAPGGPGKCNPPVNITYPTGLKAAAPGAVTFVNGTVPANGTLRLTVGWRSAPTQ